MLKVSNKDTRTTPLVKEQRYSNFEHISRHWRRSGVFIVNFEHISHIALVFTLLTLSM